MYKRFAIWRNSSSQQAELLAALHAHTGLILSCAGRVLGNIADAEDVAQDMVESLLRSPPREVRHWPAFLKTMACNRAIDQLRKRKKLVEPDKQMPSDASQPDESAEQAEQAQALRTAIAKLSSRNATLFSLCYFADLSHANIALQLDMQENAVTVALHRIRKQLANDIRLQLEQTDSGVDK
jgi:RNA polymerase sigma-70 factor (ECF subfamily)